MAFITFIYTVRGVQDYFIGKAVFRYISDDHEGLDLEVKRPLLKGLNLFRASMKRRPLRSKDVKVGVIGFSDGRSVTPSYSSLRNSEANVFNFYYEEMDDYGNVVEFYVNGKRLNVPPS